MIDLRDYPGNEILNIVKEYIEDILDWNNVNAKIKKMAIYGSYAKGNATEDSDLDVVVEFYDHGNLREDFLFNLFNDPDDRLYIDDVVVDINPILKSKSGDIKSYLNRVYDHNKYDHISEELKHNNKFSRLFKNYDEKRDCFILKSVHDLDDWEWDD